MTRDPARIDPILADLRRYWHAAPDLRLGQMVMGLLNLSGAPRYGEFHAEDDKVAAYLAAWAAANPPPPDPRDAEIARLRALRDRYFAAAVATADAIDGGSLGPVHSGGESDAEFQAECVRFAEGLPARAAKVRAELASIDGALRDCYALARAKLARESRPGGWADIVRFCERAGIKASPLRSAEARDAAKADVPTLPPEIEAAIAAAAWTVAELDRRADVMAQPEIADLRTAITSALAAAREAGRREALEGAAGVEEAIEAWGKAAICGYAAQGTIAAERKRSAIRAAIAAAIDHAAKGMRPVLSQADAAKLIDAYGVDAALHGALGATGDARAALLASLTGADAPNPTQCGAVDMLRDTMPPEIEAAIADAGQALVDAWDSAQDGPPHRFAVYTDPEGDPEVAAGWMAMACMHASALAAAREAGRREALEGAAGVETSLLKLAAVAYSQGTHAVRARIGEDGADRDHLRASGDLIVAEQSHRAAIAADKAALDDTWRAHDLERDAEVAQAQAATHEACAALQAICAALHVAPPTGSTYCTEAVTMVVERVAADKAREVETGISSAFAKLLPGRPTPDEARRLVEEAIGAGMALACHGDWSDEQRAVDRAHADSARAALLRALGVEA